MKKVLTTLCCISVLTLIGCGTNSTENTPTNSSLSQRFTIVDGADSGENLILAGETASEVYTISLADVPIYLDGEPADATALEDGMPVQVQYDTIEETFPAQLGNIASLSAFSLGSQENPGGGYYDLCGLYLQVLEDLWEKDSGLNGGITYLSVDLSQAPGDLTEGEKAAIAWIFATSHEAESLTLTREQLKEQGYLSPVDMEEYDGPPVYQWEDGLLFKITPVEQEEDTFYSLPVLEFNAEKWRTPLGAYYLNHCQVVWGEFGSWGSYSIGSEMIS